MVHVDTTVQEKQITHPTDLSLYLTALMKLVPKAEIRVLAPAAFLSCFEEHRNVRVKAEAKQLSLSHRLAYAILCRASMGSRDIWRDRLSVWIRARSTAVSIIVLP